MKLLDKIGKLANIAQSREEMQEDITVIEVWSLWNHLTSRYQIITQTQLLASFARDSDLKLLLNEGLKVLNQQATMIEKELDAYGIPLPAKPPAKSSTALNVEMVTDQYIFKTIFAGVAGYMPTHFDSVLHATCGRLREMFLTFLLDELSVYDKLVFYGQAKEWIQNPPMYRV